MEIGYRGVLGALAGKRGESGTESRAVIGDDPFSSDPPPHMMFTSGHLRERERARKPFSGR